jgi:hypothetical protein
MEQYTPHSPGDGGRIPPDDPVRTPTDAFRDATARFGELKEYISYYIAAKRDQIKASIRSAALYGVLGIVAALILMCTVIMGVVLLTIGIAYGLTALFGDRAWLGFIVAGVIFLVVTGVPAYLGVQILKSSARKRTVQKYEQWQHHQRQHFGTDVEQKAARE